MCVLFKLYKLVLSYWKNKNAKNYYFGCTFKNYFT